MLRSTTTILVLLSCLRHSNAFTMTNVATNLAFLPSNRKSKRSIRTTSASVQQQVVVAAASCSSDNIETNNDADGVVGLYRPFADHAWSKLLNEMKDLLFLEEVDIDPSLASNIAPAKFPPDSQVRMTVRALRPTKKSVVRYARYALLETIAPPDPAETTSSASNDSMDTSYNCTAGIQVLNLVIFPSKDSNLPVWGADVVSLPGDKHLLLLDGQPMDPKTKDDQVLWLEWFKTHVLGKDPDVANFPWGGDFPPEVKRFVSEYALWSRLSGPEATTKIQTEFWQAYKEHLDLYLILLSSYYEEGKLDNEQDEYIDYRLNNDPAKPMLKSLYGEEWTNQVLNDVLFPSKSTH